MQADDGLEEIHIGKLPRRCAKRPHIEGLLESSPDLWLMFRLGPDKHWVEVCRFQRHAGSPNDRAVQEVAMRERTIDGKRATPSVQNAEAERSSSKFSPHLGGGVRPHASELRLEDPFRPLA
jgi:hypothetical protein